MTNADIKLYDRDREGFLMKTMINKIFDYMKYSALYKLRAQSKAYRGPLLVFRSNSQQGVNAPITCWD